MNDNVNQYAQFISKQSGDSNFQPEQPVPQPVDVQSPVEQNKDTPTDPIAALANFITKQISDGKAN